MIINELTFTRNGYSLPSVPNIIICFGLRNERSTKTFGLKCAILTCLLGSGIFNPSYCPGISISYN